jgi:DNA invertase Pin-like site-specific DNA recombinase
MNKNLNKKQIFFLYARKSSESEDRQVQSIEDQISHLETLAKSLNIEIKEILKESKSAKEPYIRPIFASMLKRIEKGEANGILCWQMNRLSRNPVDSGTIHWMLQKGILECIQTIDRKYLPDDNVLLFNVESGMANQFIIDLKKSSWRGMEGKADRGWLPSRPPLGYLNEKIEHTIIEDIERFALVRRMWDMMLTGNYTQPKILKIANKEWGFRTPKFKRSGGGELATSTMYKMFTNIFYTGMFEWAGKVYNGNHKPMITLDEYDRVQAILGKSGKPRVKKHEFAYTGIMSCGECGGMITATEKQKIIKKTGELKTYIYYHCGHKKKGVKCNQREPLTLEELETQIAAELQKYTILPEFREWALAWLRNTNDKEIEDRTKIYEMRHQSLVQAQRELDNLTRMRYKELIDDETFIQEGNALKGQIAKLKAELRETENRAEKWIEFTEKTFHFASYAHIAFTIGTIEQKREIFAALGQNYTLIGKKVSIEANDWLLPIEKAYPELEAEFRRLELQKYPSNEARNVAFSSLILRWGATVDVIRTIFEERNDTTIYIPSLQQLENPDANEVELPDAA